MQMQMEMEMGQGWRVGVQLGGGGAREKVEPGAHSPNHDHCLGCVCVATRAKPHQRTETHEHPFPGYAGSRTLAIAPADSRAHRIVRVRSGTDCRIAQALGPPPHGPETGTPHTQTHHTHTQTNTNTQRLLACQARVRLFISCGVGDGARGRSGWGRETGRRLGWVGLVWFGSSDTNTNDSSVGVRGLPRHTEYCVEVPPGVCPPRENRRGFSCLSVNPAKNFGILLPLKRNLCNRERSVSQDVLFF